MSERPVRPPASDAIRARVEAVRVAQLFSRNLLPQVLNLPFSLAVGAVLWQVAPHPLVLRWLAIKLTTGSLRWALNVGFRRAQRPVDSATWTRRQMIVLGVDAFAWGLLGVWFADRSAGLWAAPFLGVVVGLVAIAAQIGSTHFEAAASFLLPLVLPSALHQVLYFDLLGGFLGSSLLLMMALVLLDGRRAERAHIELLTLRFQVAEESEAREVALEEARRHSAVKSQFLATMSHEMRTPLHGILGTARLLREGLGDDGRIEQVELIVRSGEHLLGVINDVLDFSRIDAGRLRVREEPFDLAQAVREAVAPLVGAAEEQGLVLRLEEELGDPAFLMGDAARVRQIVMNLVGNALKFTEQGGIHVAVRREGEQVLIAVRDTGQGIAAADLPTIFDAFHQADSSFSRLHPGSGLGLTISRELAQAMGGELTCQSELGRGSTFTLALPWRPAPPRTADNLERVARHRLSGTVLLVEDHAINVTVACALLLRLGVNVEVARDGAAGVVQWEATAPDAVLMDLHLPGMDGFEATRAIRAREGERGRARTPVLAVSAAVSAEEQERCRAAGMDAFLSKPFGEVELFTVLARFLPGDDRPITDGERGSGEREATGSPLAGRAEAVARLGGDEEIYDSVLRDFAGHGPELLASLRTSLLEPDTRSDAARFAHTLKGLAATVGAPSLFGAALRLEESLQRGESGSQLARLLADCDQEMQRIAAAVVPSTPPARSAEVTAPG